MIEEVARYESVALRTFVRDRLAPLCDRLAAVAELANRHEAAGFLAEAKIIDDAAVGSALVGCFLANPETLQDTDQTGLCAVARSEVARVATRLLTLEHITRPENLAAVAVTARAPEVGICAVLRLVEAGARSQLFDVRDHAENAHVRLFAHALLAQDDGK